MLGALRPWLKTWYMGISRNSWSTAGRQPEAGLTPRSLYSFICSSETLARLPLYLTWMALSSGWSICIRRWDTICFRNRGTSRNRMMSVRATMAVPMSPNRL